MSDKLAYLSGILSWTALVCIISAAILSALVARLPQEFAVGALVLLVVSVGCILAAVIALALSLAVYVWGGA